MHRQRPLLFGTSAVVTKVLHQCARYARTRDPIVLMGERGTGKTAIAAHIHQLSGRAGPFISESAAVLSRDLELARLVGHARGAFTDAREDRVGLLESSNGGTFFLDEIQLASDNLQGILLRLMEQETVRRMGEIRDRPVDLRMVVASNEDLHVLAAGTRFRPDLLDRLGYMVVRVPPLAERRDEILPLAERFVREMAGELGLAPAPGVSHPVRDLLLSAGWPGNIRQLRSVCRAAVALSAPGMDIGPGDLPYDFVASLGDTGRARHTQAVIRSRIPRGDLPGMIEHALAQTGGDRKAAARVLGVSRTQFYRYLEQVMGPADSCATRSSRLAQFGGSSQGS